MKIISIFILTFLLIPHAHLLGQVTEIECSVYKRSDVSITLTPAHYDPAFLPQVGDKVMLSLYVKDNLPANKQEGYYELFIIQVIKLIPETKSITFKAEEDIEAAKVKYGISKMNLSTESRVKISWGR